MLARQITDHHESGAGAVGGLGLLAVDIEFAAEKRLGNPAGQALGVTVSGYEIHHGAITRRGPACAGLITHGASPEGAWQGCVLGTHWHGLLESDEFRRRFLTWAAATAGRAFVAAPDVSFAAAREGQLCLLGDLVARHLDTAGIEELIENGAPPGLPLLPPGAS
jgi:adenosylcobyric acid synthase